MNPPWIWQDNPFTRSSGRLTSALLHGHQIADVSQDGFQVCHSRLRNAKYKLVGRCTWRTLREGVRTVDRVSGDYPRSNDKRWKRNRWNHLCEGGTGQCYSWMWSNITLRTTATTRLAAQGNPSGQREQLAHVNFPLVKENDDSTSLNI